MSYILKLKTNNAYNFKASAELIQKFVKDGCWCADENGLKLVGKDTKTNSGTKLIYVEIPKSTLNKYIITNTQLKIGVNTVHFYRMLKSIKKKGNTLTLFIKKDDPLKLYMQINQNGESENKGVVGHINITYVQPVIYDQPVGYGDPIIVSPIEFQKIKILNKISKTMELISNNRLIDLTCDKEGVYSKTVTLGDDDSDDKEDQKENEEEYRQTFDSEQILELVKVASTSSTNIKMYTTTELPLCVKMSSGNWPVSIYYKSKETLIEEQDEEDPSIEIA